ncbi:DUF4260 domain-containing protein [Brucella pituitosa]|uniref:DUF4260 domain-containing protein n=1 Tax=Brucella pituitosa TaxID=571256 RepID=A0A643F1Q3_9HYPH|nr:MULTISPECIES: DUF4260 domain-containing protein [Brucella]PQZ48840.1 DUF4260 domain-containing protein [Ochrobactrum sp. MYb19]PRA57955.1 DUF4260 domain-containing protein [Ochrobactrum sp. MYb68]PRA67342.1 DUF4260 domain-containing protein [Ochrobactrum sp. MYb18]PRA77698.1 DUF4260 domain-containing protein [Brucella thiophenivorans]PRA88629.1 DUF4260 domain-containing protein [Ochrobactrum sp. MYb29]PRA92352.1 DUF4260 domain-containing protein [Ochrobactrum sp. MYb14]PRA99708.1 DUF4260 
MNLIQRLESLSLALLALGAYWISGVSWWLFAALILAPDLSFFAYMKGPRTGAVVYNIAHSWIGVVLLSVLGWAMSWPLCFAIALIWAVHIGVDRALGFGLKYGTGFKDTHLGRIGS